MTVGFVVHAAGPLLLVQDAGRPGLLAQGVSPSGFADAASAARANRLVGNPEHAAVLESVFGGVELEAVGGALVVAVAGVEVALEVVDGARTRGFAAEEPVTVPAGARLRVGAPRRGLRPTIAVRGGVDAPAVLGSRSRDTLAGLGPAPVVAGDRLAVGALAGGWPGVDLAVLAPARADGALVLDFVWGPREDRLTEAGRGALLAERTVGARGDRVGVQLVGAAIGHVDARLPSEATVAGAVELPPDGLPFVLGRDHPVTVGYPVVGVVTAAALDRLAQAVPGTAVRLRPVG